jgi:acyl-CoA thioester hydrolase
MSNGKLLTYKGSVYPWHCDQMGHMNVMWYVGKFDEATWHLFQAIGITPTLLRENNRGMAAVEQQISYKRELLAGDIVNVYSEVLEIKDRVLRFHHEMRKADTDEVAATTTLTGVHLDKAARRACAFPPEVREKAAAFIRPASA